MKRNITKRNTILVLGIIGLGITGLVVGQGMMGGFGNPAFGQGMTGRGMNQGMMGGGMMGGGMIGGGMGMMAVYPSEVTPITEAQAQSLFEDFARRFGSEVRVADVMSFANNYYAQLVTTSGEGIGEVLVDRFSGVVTPEPGPNMMWNTGSGMRLAFGGQERFDEAAATELANTFLGSYLPGASVTNSQSFPGYYTFDFGRQNTEGMLSVNTYSGEVWVHSWHGTFLGENE